MGSFHKMYCSSYSDANYYTDRFAMGGRAYRESFDGSVEKLRIVAVISAHTDSRFDEAVDRFDVDYDYDVIFINGHTKYCVAFESDGEIDELPGMLEIIWC